MKKNNVNFIIDAIMFIMMMAIIGIGLLLKYILVSGEKRWELYGNNMDMQILGLDRHQWGNIHLIIGIILSVLLLVHIVLHWRQITCIFPRLIKQSGARKSLTAIFILASIVLLTFPWLVPLQITAFERGHGRQNNHQPEALAKTIDNPVSNRTNFTAPDNNENSKAVQQTEEHEHLKDSNIQINGQMTIESVSEQYNIPQSVLVSGLKLPAGTSATERLGRLRRVYDFRMSDITEIISEYQTTQ